MTITEFLLARIAEDEESARGACRVRESQQGDSWTIVRGTYEDKITVQGKAVIGSAHIGATHIARHDPAHVLVECAAKRAIIALYRQEDLESSDRGRYFYAEGAGDAVKALAAVYKDHPDYRQEWAA